MGWLASLFGTRQRSNIQDMGDRVWISHAAKLRGVLQDVRRRADSNADLVLVVAHFAATVDEFAELITGQTFRCPVSIVSAQELDREFGERLQLGEDLLIDVVVCERHPHADLDQATGRFASQLQCRVRIGHHLSLDDPLLKRFSGPSIALLLESIGMKETESIDSPVVSRRIRSTQKKIAAQIANQRMTRDPFDLERDQVARSADEWFRVNSLE